MGTTCRTSGVLSASTVVATSRSLITSIHFVAITDGTNRVTIKVFDSDSATVSGKTEVARFIYHENNATPGGAFEYDMHNVICENGIYLQITAGGTSSAAVSVEFA